METKILVLGNEFIESDSFSKIIMKELKVELGLDVINIKDSFQLLDYLMKKQKLILVDVVEKLGEVRELTINDLRQRKILSTHDFDAGFLLKLIESDHVKIIGLPMNGDKVKIKNELLKLLFSKV